MLAFLVLIAAYIRVEGANAYFLNSDEMLYLRMAQGRNVSEVLRFSLNETHPPLYSFLLHFWIKISDSVAFLRSLSLVFGLLLIPLYYRIGKMLGNEFSGFCCAVLIAFGYGEIIESYIVRNYSLFVFCLSLCFYYMLRWQKDKSASALTGYFCSGLLSCFSHFSAAFPIFCMGAVEIISLLGKDKTFRGKLIGWLGANVALACVVLLAYAHWRPTMEYYGTGASFDHFSLSAKLMSRAILSPFASLSYLLPYIPSTAYALALYVTVITLILRAVRAEEGQARFLASLMATALFTNFLIHGLGLNAVQGLTAGFAFTRHDLWLMPFVIPITGMVFALAARKYAEVLPVNGRRWSGMGAMLACCVIFSNFTGRFGDEEYMISISSYSQLVDYLKQLDSHSFVMADRITGFLIIPKEYNPYRYMKHAQWADEKMTKLFPYYNAHVLFDAQNVRFMRKEELQGFYANPETQFLLNNTSSGKETLVFINLQQPSWKSAVLDQLAHCDALNKEVAAFPEKQVEIIRIQRSVFENDLLAAHGKAHACLTARPNIK